MMTNEEHNIGERTDYEALEAAAPWTDYVSLDEAAQNLGISLARLVGLINEGSLGAVLHPATLEVLGVREDDRLWEMQEGSK
jgi:hypothetical protein